MNDFCVFLNTRVENSGTLSRIGDMGLSPVRCLFNGQTVSISPAGLSSHEVHHVASFHRKGACNYSKTDWQLKSHTRGLLEVVAAIVLLIPGLFLATAKALAYYLSEDVCKKHRLVKEHFTPIDRTIGTPQKPITSIEELKAALDVEWKSNHKHQPTNELTIYGDENFKISSDPGIMQFNPMKLILVKTNMIHDANADDSLDNLMLMSDKWQTTNDRLQTTSIHATYARIHRVANEDFAHNYSIPLRSWFSWKRYHAVFHIS